MESPDAELQHPTDAASAPVGSIDHILRGVLSDVLTSADDQLAAAAATAGDDVLEEGRQVRLLTVCWQYAFLRRYCAT